MNFRKLSVTFNVTNNKQKIEVLFLIKNKKRAAKTYLKSSLKIHIYNINVWYITLHKLFQKKEGERWYCTRLRSCLLQTCRAMGVNFYLMEIAFLGSQELRSSVVSVLLSLIPGTASIAGPLY